MQLLPGRWRRGPLPLWESPVGLGGPVGTGLNRPRDVGQLLSLTRPQFAHLNREQEHPPRVGCSEFVHMRRAGSP